MKTIIIIGIALFILIILAKYYKRCDVVEGLAMCPESHKFPYQVRGPFVGTAKAKTHYNEMWNLATERSRAANATVKPPNFIPDTSNYVDESTRYYSCCEVQPVDLSEANKGKLNGDNVDASNLAVTRDPLDKYCPSGSSALPGSSAHLGSIEIGDGADWNKGQRSEYWYTRTGFWGEKHEHYAPLELDTTRNSGSSVNENASDSWAAFKKYGREFTDISGSGTIAYSDKWLDDGDDDIPANNCYDNSFCREGGDLGDRPWYRMNDDMGYWSNAATAKDWTSVNSLVSGTSERTVLFDASLSDMTKNPNTMEKIYKCGSDKDAICPDKFHPSIQMYDKYLEDGTQDPTFKELGANLNGPRWSDCSHLNKNCGLPVDYETVAADVFSTYPVPSENAFADASKIPVNFFPNILKASSGNSGWFAQIDDNDAIKIAANRCSSTCSAMENCTGCFTVSGLVDPSFIDWAKRNIRASEVEPDKAVGFFLAKNLTASADGQPVDPSSAQIIAMANDSINLANSTWYTTARKSLHHSKNKMNLDFPGGAQPEDMSGVILTPPEGLMSKWHSNGCITNVLPVPDGHSWTEQYNENRTSFDGPNNPLLTHCTSSSVDPVNQAKSMWCCAHTSCSDISGVSCGKGVDDSRGKYYAHLAPEEISKNAAAGGGLSYDASSTIQDTLYIQSQIWLKGLSYSDSSPHAPQTIIDNITTRILDISGSKTHLDDILQKISRMAANDKAVVRVAAAKAAGSNDGGSGSLQIITDDVTTAENYRKIGNRGQEEGWMKYAIEDASNLNTDPKGWRDNYNLIMPIKDRYDNSIAILTQKREALNARITLAGQLCLRESSMANGGQCPTDPMTSEELLNFDKDRIQKEKDYTEAAVKKQCRIVDADLLAEIDTQRDQIKLQSEEMQLQSEEIENAQSMEESYTRLLGDYSKVLDKAITVIPSHAQISAATKSLQTTGPPPLQAAGPPPLQAAEGFMSRRKTKYSIREGYTSTKDGYGNINITCRNNGGAAGAGAGAAGAGAAGAGAGAGASGAAGAAGAAGVSGFEPGHQFDHGGLTPFSGGCS